MLRAQAWCVLVLRQRSLEWWRSCFVAMPGLGVVSTSSCNATVWSEKSKAVKDIMARRAKFKGQPQRILPQHCGVHNMNRKGQLPSIMYVHGPLTANVKRDGHDSNRPRAGIVIKC